jgi:hypothetical protein
MSREMLVQQGDDGTIKAMIMVFGPSGMPHRVGCGVMRTAPDYSVLREAAEQLFALADGAPREGQEVPISQVLDRIDALGRNTNVRIVHEATPWDYLYQGLEVHTDAGE